MSIVPKELRREELDAIRARHTEVRFVDPTTPRLNHVAHDRGALLGHVEALEDEADFHERLIFRQGRLLTGVVNAIRGMPGELASHSHHDAPQLAARAMELLRLLTFAGRISGGTAGRDENLCVALDAAEAFLAPVKPLTDPGAELPGWEAVCLKAERGEPLNPIEALVMRLTPGDDERARDFRRMLRAALDYTAAQAKGTP